MARSAYGAHHHERRQLWITLEPPNRSTRAGRALHRRRLVDRRDAGRHRRRRGRAARRCRARVHSKVRPWRGTFGEVDRAARSFAASLQAQGVGPGDVVVFQLPNWVEAAITFWGAAQLGAVVVPIVHFYGPKEVGYVLDVVQPDAVVTRGPLRADRLPGHLRAVAPRAHRHARGSSSAPTARPFPVTPATSPSCSTPSRSRLRCPTDPDSPAVIGFTSGTTRNPKGVIHSHRTLGFEVRQLGAMAGVDTPAHAHRRSRRPLHRHAQRAAAPAPQATSASTSSTCGIPARCCASCRRRTSAWAAGAAFFVTSVLDHPDFTPEHLALMPHRRHGRLHHPAGHHRAPGLVRHQGVPLLRQHRAPVDHRVLGPRPGAEAPRHRRRGAARRRDAPRRGRRDLQPRSRPLPRLHRPGADRERVRRRGLVPHRRRRRARRRRATCRSPTGCPTSSSGAARTSAPKRSKSSCSACPRSPRSRWSPSPTTASASAPRPSCGLLPGEPAPTLEDVRAHLAEVGLAKQKWPESIHPVVDLPRTPSGKVQKFKLRQQLREGSLEHAVPSD